MAREVNRTGKDEDGDITSLCGDGFVVDKATAIEETMAAGNGRDGADTPYCVQVVDVGPVNVRVYDRTVGETKVRYLRTDADRTTTNNLDDLPDC